MKWNPAPTQCSQWETMAWLWACLLHYRSWSGSGDLAFRCAWFIAKYTAVKFAKQYLTFNSFMTLEPGQRKLWYSYQDHCPSLRSWLYPTSGHSSCWQRTWCCLAGGGSGRQSMSGQWLEGGHKLHCSYCQSANPGGLRDLRSRRLARCGWRHYRRNGIWSTQMRICTSCNCKLLLKSCARKE